jgi:Fic family protein
VFETALIIVLFISYIQPFEDGNKRTGRITGNGLLIENGYCPLSYRSIKPIDYKKAMILFYEQKVWLHIKSYSSINSNLPLIIISGKATVLLDAGAL